MKFRLLERNFWGEHDVWLGRKLKYKVEIGTPFRSKHAHYGKYSFTIKTPYKSVHNTHMTGLFFESLEECMNYVQKWIVEDYENNKK